MPLIVPIASGGVPVGKLITHRLGLHEAHEGFRVVCDPVANDCVKVIIAPHG